MVILDPGAARTKAEREYNEGVELLKAAYELKLQAIRVVEMMGGSAAQVAEAPKATKAPSSDSQRELKRGELPGAFMRILPKLNETFDKDQVFRALKAFEAEVAALTNDRAVSLLLNRLNRSKEIEIAVKGSGRFPTSYRRKELGPRAVKPAAPEESSPEGSDPPRAVER